MAWGSLLAAAKNAESWVIAKQREADNPEVRAALEQNIAYAATMRMFAETGGRSLLAGEE